MASPTRYASTFQRSPGAFSRFTTASTPSSFAPGARREDARADARLAGISQSGLLAAFVGSEWERKGLEPAIRALALTPGVGR